MRREQEMDVVGHYDERVEREVGSVVLEAFDEKLCVAVNVEDVSALPCGGGYEVCAWDGAAGWDGQNVTSAAKAATFSS